MFLTAHTNIFRSIIFTEGLNFFLNFSLKTGIFFFEYMFAFLFLNVILMFRKAAIMRSLGVGA